MHPFCGSDRLNRLELFELTRICEVMRIVGLGGLRAQTFFSLRTLIRGNGRG
jgi:hypothetical protein